MRSKTLAFALAVLCAGCAHHNARVTQALPGPLYANDADAQMSFWHTLADRRLFPVRPHAFSIGDLTKSDLARLRERE